MTAVVLPMLGAGSATLAAEARLPTWDPLTWIPAGSVDWFAAPAVWQAAPLLDTFLLLLLLLILLLLLKLLCSEGEWIKFAVTLVNVFVPVLLVRILQDAHKLLVVHPSAQGKHKSGHAIQVKIIFLHRI